MRRAALDAPPPRDFAGALRAGPTGALAVVAEIKRRSPSKGDLAPDLDPAVDREGLRARRRALRSRCSPTGPYFGGSVADLQAARARRRRLPVLRKDFTIDAVQVYEARAIGADASC